MLRITTWRSTGTPANPVTPQDAVQAWNNMCTELEKLPGAGKISWYFGNGGIVTVGEADSYALADTILRTAAAQVAVARVLSLGYGIAEDQFLLEPAQVMPFAQQQGAVPAQLSRN